ncbi:MAG: PmbA/TldA family metallopeptidase, partial [Planctomycetota bacterium]
MNRRDAAKHAMQGALDSGADAADALSVESRRTTLQVRKGDLETSREAETRGVGVRAFRDGCLGIAYTTSMDPAALKRAGSQAAELARISGRDEAAGLPDSEHLATLGASIDGIEDPDFESFDAAAAVEQARACEAAAFAHDERITNSEEACFDANRSQVALASSGGFEGEYARTRFSLSMVVIAEEEGGILQRDGWWTASPRLGA